MFWSKNFNKIWLRKAKAPYQEPVQEEASKEEPEKPRVPKAIVSSVKEVNGFIEILTHCDSGPYESRRLFIKKDQISAIYLYEFLMRLSIQFQGESPICLVDFERKEDAYKLYDMLYAIITKAPSDNVAKVKKVGRKKAVK